MVENRGGQIIDKENEREAWLEKIQFLSDAMESTSQPFCAGDRDGSILVFNVAFSRLIGYTREELLDINWATDLTVPESLESEFKILRVLDETHQSQRYEKSYRRKDGTVVPVEILVDLASDSKGQTLFYYSFITDITERKRAEKALRLAKFTINNTSEEVLWIEPNGHIFDVNKAACTALEYTPEELSSMYVWDIDPNYPREVWLSHWQELKERRVFKFESTQRAKCGRIFPTEVTVNYIAFEGAEYNCAVVRDITERKQAEEVLRESEEKFRTLAETASVGIMLFREDKYIYTNPYMQNFLGYSEEELLAMNFWDVVHPDFRELVRVRGSERLQGLPVPSRYDLKIITKSGETRWGDYSADVIKYGGRPTVIGVYLDITERKRAREALVKSESNLKKAQEIAHLGSWVWDLATDKVTGSDELYRMFGLTPDPETPLQQFIEKLVPEYRQKVLDALDETARYGKPLDIEYEVIPHGDIRLVIHDKAEAYYMDGKPAKVFGTVLDITERKQAEKALRESEEMFRALAESARAEIVLIKGNRFIYVNPERIRALGYTKEELMAMKVEDTIHPDMRETVRDRVLRRLRGEPVPSQYEVKMITKSGEARWEELSSTVIDYKGEPTIMSTSFNITDRKRAEKEMKEAKMQAELYLDLMGHDLTNMNQALMGNLEMLEILSESGEIDRGLIDSSLKIINRSSRMISDVKKLTQLQSGGVPPEEVDICKMLEAVKVRYSTVPERSVTIKYTPEERCLVQASDLLEDVFDNLVDNAIRHSRGPVTIDLAIDRASLEGRQYYRITIADTGPGIPDDLKKKIFMTIDDIDAGEKLKRRGFGLFLARTLIGYYHGKVWVEDRVPGDPTKGAKFVVMLPATEK